MKIVRIFAIAASLGMVSPALSAPISFFGTDADVFNQSGTATGNGFATAQAAQTDFLSNLTSSVGTEDFESYSDGTSGPLAISFPGAGTATLTGSGAVDDDPGTGQNATSGTNWWRTGAGNDFSITFDAPVAAFGFFGIDVGDIGAVLTLTLAGGSSIDIEIPQPTGGAQNGSVFYFGYIDADNPWTSATFSNVGGGSGDDFGFDDMTIGSVTQVAVNVPEPGALALLGLGLLGLSLAGRRRV